MTVAELIEALPKDELDATVRVSVRLGDHYMEGEARIVSLLPDIIGDGLLVCIGAGQEEEEEGCTP